jgi:hypothetical protein
MRTLQSASRYVAALLCTVFLFGIGNIRSISEAQTPNTIFLPTLSTSFPFQISPLQQVSRPFFLPGSDLPRIDTTYVATITNTSSTTAYSITLNVEIHSFGYSTKTVTPTLPIIAPGATVPVVVPVDNYRFFAQNLQVVAADAQSSASYQTIPVTLTAITCQNNGIGIITGIVRNTTANALMVTDIVVWRTESPPHTAIASIATGIDAGQERLFQTSAMYICDGQKPAADVQLTDFTGVAVGRLDTSVQ